MKLSELKARIAAERERNVEMIVRGTDKPTYLRTVGYIAALDWVREQASAKPDQTEETDFLDLET